MRAGRVLERSGRRPAPAARPGEETIWYYAHEQDKVKQLSNDMTELLEKKLARYLNEQ